MADKKIQKEWGLPGLFLKIWPSNVFSQIKSTQKPGIWVKMAYLDYRFEKLLIQIFQKSPGNPHFFGIFSSTIYQNWKLISFCGWDGFFEKC